MAESPEAERTTGTTRTDRGLSKWLAGLVSLVGAWVAVSPFVLGEAIAAVPITIDAITADTITTVMTPQAWNNVAVGIAVFVVAGYNFYRTVRDRNVSVAGSGLVALLGLWLVVAPFVAFEMVTALLWSTVLSGLVALVVSAYNAYVGREARAETAAGTT